MIGDYHRDSAVTFFLLTDRPKFYKRRQIIYVFNLKEVTIDSIVPKSLLKGAFYL